MKKENTEVKTCAIKQALAKLSKKQKVIIAGVAVVIAGAVVASQFCCSGTGIDKIKPIAMKKDTSPVIAMIGQQEIRMSELEKVKNAIPQLATMPMETVYNNLLEGYVTQKVLLSAANAKKLQDRPDIQKAISDAKDQILVNAYLAEEVQARMTQDKLNALYMEAIKNYVPQDEIHARHILVATEKEAKDLIVKLKGGANFEELASEVSLDTNAVGGDLGYFRKEMMIPDFANAAFAIKVGQISEKPIKTAFGWHVVKVEDKRKAAPPSIGEVLDVLKAKFQEIMLPVIVDEEKKKANVSLLDPLGINKEEEKAEETAVPEAEETADAPAEEKTPATEEKKAK
ncbi:MAG: hypothetical protein E7013_01435 [Alphaproteobacteria bacterium]|nr:hypothetical protein [Alphaproteobacteria bacterium]